MASTRPRTGARTAVRKTQRKTATPAAAGRRDAILAVAMNAFAASGFDGVRLHEIARAARMNQATLVYYFPSKRALYEASLAEAADQLMDAFAEGTREADGRSAADTI